MVLAQLQRDLAELRDSAIRSLAAIDVLLGTETHVEEKAPPPPVPIKKPVIKRTKERPQYNGQESLPTRVMKIVRNAPDKTWTVEELQSELQLQGWVSDSPTSMQYLQLLLRRMAKKDLLIREITTETKMGRPVMRYGASQIKKD